MSYRYKQIPCTLSNLLLLVLVLSLYHLEWQRKIEIRTEGYFVCVFILCISIHYVYMQGSVLRTLLYALCMCLRAPDYMHLCVLVCMCVKVRQGCYAGVKWTPLW